MDDAAIVRRFERLRDLADDRQQLLERHGADGDPLGKGLARNQLHLDDAPVVEIPEPEQRGDVRVIEGGQHTRFALEAREPVGIGRQGVVQHLEGDFAPEPQVFGSKHLSHAARAEHVEQTVPSDRRSRNHCHWMWTARIIRPW